jgi:RNA polymerase sigma factor for flagellar operon FliA
MNLRLPPNISLDDLVSAGIMGLLDAIDKFNEDRGVSFKSYAEFRIRGAMLDELRSLDWVPRSVRKNAKVLEAAYAKVENNKMRPAKDEEVARELGVTMEAFYQLLDETRGVLIINNDEVAQLVPQGDTNPSGQILLGGIAARSPLDSLNLTEIRDVIAAAIENLPENERMVMALYYFEELTMREIGEVMGYTESRISQLHTKATLRLRTSLREYFEP